MHKDWKIGLAAGLTVVLAAVVKFALDPRLGIRARFSYNPDTNVIQQQAENPSQQPNLFVKVDKESTEISTQEPVSSPFQSHIERPEPQVVRFEPNKPAEAVLPAKKFHIVQKDQSLWSIAQLYYGKGQLWKKIYEVNRSEIKDPNALSVGTKLLIPD
jgi:nucleoid-associated protein YgaU